MKGFLICLGLLAVLAIVIFCIYYKIMSIIDARLPDLPVDNTAAIIQECPKLKAAVDKLTERILALEQAKSKGVK